jgi:hypothetical protein
MTIAMMIEMLAGKGAALHGLVHDATPFKFSEDDDAIDHFAKQLVTVFMEIFFISATPYLKHFNIEKENYCIHLVCFGIVWIVITN